MDENTMFVIFYINKYNRILKILCYKEKLILCIKASKTINTLYNSEYLFFNITF